MSGNPFRRSRNVEALSSPTADSRDESSTPPKHLQTKKRVNIIPNSPELQLENGTRRLSASDSTARAVSPPPLAPVFDAKEDEFELATGVDQDLEEAFVNTRRNSGALAPNGITLGVESGMKAPYNPFGRTMASAANVEEVYEGDNVGQERQTGGRIGLDVDQFKNILLTGNAAISTAGKDWSNTARAALPQPYASQDHDGRADAKFGVNPAYSLRPGSPRFMDDYEDTSESDEHENEHTKLMGEGRLDDLAPPAPPKPKSRVPQTVSFADFDQTIPADFQSSGRSTPSVKTKLSGILRPTPVRSSSDLNKPLPPRPQSPNNLQPPNVPAINASNFALPAEDREVEERTSSKRTTPPPPPPSRRKAGETGRPRSVSNLSDTTLDSQSSIRAPETEALSSVESSVKVAPVPPRSRKAHLLGEASEPSIETPLQARPLINSSDELTKSAPSPPPRRNQSKLEKVAHISQSSSNSGRTSQLISQRPGDAFLTSLMTASHLSSAPPAPPRRRPKQTNIDNLPTNTMGTAGIESHQRTSESSIISDLLPDSRPYSLSEEVGPLPAEETRDVLADMKAFQAQIDALRAQGERNG